MSWTLIMQDDEFLRLGFGDFGKQISNRWVDVVKFKGADYIWTKSWTGHDILLTFLIHL